MPAHRKFSDEELIEAIKKHTCPKYTEIARELGVSNVAVKKRIANLSIKYRMYFKVNKQ